LFVFGVLDELLVLERFTGFMIQHRSGNEGVDG
jgi:hypothetical protein